jgi:hypothetical protein
MTIATNNHPTAFYHPCMTPGSLAAGMESPTLDKYFVDLLLYT